MENETEKGNITQEKNDFIEKYSGITWSEILQSLAHPHNPDELKAVKIKGDSMKNERINNCDIVLFHPQKTEGNGFYVVSVGNSLVIKRVDFDPSNERIMLISANPAYKP